jgi:hypothetical protein
MPNKVPIRIPKPPYRKKRPNIFKEGPSEIPDPMSDFQFLHQQKVGNTIKRSTKLPREENDLDPQFQLKFDESKHGDELRKNLCLDPTIPREIKNELINIIKEYWSCFCEEKVTVPIRDYECVIDTGTAKPIHVRNMRYGPNETPVMEKAIDSLLSLDQIEPITDGEWMSRAVIAPKPHQEDIFDIDQFVWRFCINYIPLNQIT